MWGCNPILERIISSINWSIITGRKRSLGQGNVFTPVCLLMTGGSPYRDICLQEADLPPRNQKSGRYALYWNAFLSVLMLTRSVNRPLDISHFQNPVDARFAKENAENTFWLEAFDKAFFS